MAYPHSVLHSSRYPHRQSVYLLTSCQTAKVCLVKEWLGLTPTMSCILLINRILPSDNQSKGRQTGLCHTDTLKNKARVDRLPGLESGSSSQYPPSVYFVASFPGSCPTYRCLVDMCGQPRNETKSSAKQDFCCS